MSVWCARRATNPASKLEPNALELSPEQRARLGPCPVSSHNHAFDPEYEGLWNGEAGRQLEELESGEVEPVAAERVVEAARSLLR